MAIGMFLSFAPSTKRKLEYTCNDDPITSIASDSFNFSKRKFFTYMDTLSPKNTTFGFRTPPQRGQSIILNASATSSGTMTSPSGPCASVL